MKRAVIDIGTNSVRLIVADGTPGGSWKVFRKGMEPSRLGESMTDKALISPAACERTFEAVKNFTAAAKLAGAEDIRAYGTAILRESSEGQSFSQRVMDDLGISVKILPGDLEAFYSYLGAVGSASSVAAVVDIGGGSTEICMGFGPVIGFHKSFPVGCVRCSSMFDTTTARGIGELKKYSLKHFQESKDLSAIKHWVCVGGTATSLASMLLGLESYDPSKVQDYVIKAEAVSDMLRMLYQMSYEERCHVKGLRADRADIIVAGVAILDALMEYFALSEISVSDRGLSEGLLDEDVVKPEIG
jgi:exopolyphosphatase / guanosine-5'-triphosphate,3'-diphosphate pyrophosphatase